MANRPLTTKQTLFAEFYLGEAAGNATRAAALAGYKGDPVTLAAIGYENLRKPQIASRIHARVSEVAGDTNEILRQLWLIASAPMSQFMVMSRPATYDEDGTLIEPARLRLDYSSKVRALELLMRYNRMLDGKAPAETVVKALIGVDISRI
jgi:hypothetical protein